jgi:hypothetical protein
MVGSLHDEQAMRIAMLALLPGCSLYFGGSSPLDGGPSPDDPVELELTTTQTMAGANRIAGVDSDHAGGVWIAYQELTSSDLTITHLDAAKTVVTAWTYNDDQSEVSGIAVDDTGVWLNHNAIGTIGTNGVTKLDLSTGAKLFTFETQAAYGANVFVSSWDMETLTLMDKTGDILGTATSPLLHLNESASVGQFLANDGDRKLILASDSQIAWLTVASP